MALKSINFNSSVKSEIINSGGTVIFTKDNMIIASEVSEALYREMLKNPYIEKVDVISLKRYESNYVIVTGSTYKSTTNNSIS